MIVRLLPRSSSLLFGGDVETAVVMAVRRKLSYIESTLEQSEALQGIVCVNREVIMSLCKDCLRIHTQHVLRM